MSPAQFDQCLYPTHMINITDLQRPDSDGESNMEHTDGALNIPHLKNALTCIQSKNGNTPSYS